MKAGVGAEGQHTPRGTAEMAELSSETAWDAGDGQQRLQGLTERPSPLLSEQ